MHWKISRRHFERSSTISIKGPPGHIGLGRLWVLAWAYDVDVVDEYIFRPSSYNSSGQHMTRPSTASSNHTSILPLLLHMCQVQRSSGWLHWSILQGSLKRPGSFRDVFLGGKRTVHVLPPLPFCYFAHFHFISICSAQHASVNPMAKSCMDSLSFIFWNKNMIMIIVQTEINALQEMKGSPLTHEEREPFNHCWRPYKKIASNVNEIRRTRTFKLQAWYESPSEEKCVECTSQRRQIARTAVFCDETYIARKHQAAKVWLYPKPAPEDLQRVVQSVIVRIFNGPW